MKGQVSAMLKISHSPPLILSALVGVLAAVAAAGGLLIGDLYRDNLLVRSGWLGNDLVTLIVAVPILAVALGLARRGSLAAQLISLGLLDYMVYNFAFYLFGAAFNRFFLVYVACFTLSIFGLVYGLIGLDVGVVQRRLRPGWSFKWVAGLMVVIAAGLSLVYLMQSLDFIFSGRVPPIVEATGHPTSVVFALDFSMVISVLALAAVWLWQARVWGYVLAVVINVKGALYMLALSLTTLAAVRAGALSDASQIALWGFIGIACLVASVVLLSHLRTTDVT